MMKTIFKYSFSIFFLALLLLTSSCNNNTPKVLLSDSMPYVTCKKTMANLLQYSDIIVLASIESEGYTRKIPFSTGVTEVDHKLDELDVMDDLYWELTYFDVYVSDAYIGNFECGSNIKFYQIGGLNDSETKVKKGDKVVLFLTDNNELGYTTTMQEHSIFTVIDNKIYSNSNLMEFTKYNGIALNNFIQSEVLTLK